MYIQPQEFVDWQLVSAYTIHRRDETRAQEAAMNRVA